MKTQLRAKQTFLFLLLTILAPGLRAQGLGELARNAGMHYGTMVHKAQFTKAGPEYKQTLIDEFSMVFPENEIKWDAIEPARGVFKFAYPDSVIDFAQANGKKSRGHFMLWHTNIPYWVTSRKSGTNKWTRTELMSILKNHITTVMGHYKGRISEYDVVNEPINIGYGEPFGLRNSFWYDIIGPDYIDSCFVWAHRADPDAYLYLNEYGAEAASSAEYPKRDSLYKFVKELQGRGVPIHGVGFEGHFGNYINTGTISANMKKLGELGLRVSITELDMMYTSNLPNNWKNLMNAALANFNCTTFVTWGIDDLHSWKGKDCGCLVWDTLFQKKPLIYKALSDALKAADPTITTKRKAFAALPPASPTLILPKVMNINLAIAPDSKNPSIIIDNNDAACTYDSVWTASTFTPGYMGANYVIDGTDKLDRDRWAKWTPTIPESAPYKVFVRWVAGGNRPVAAPIQIKYANGDTTVRVNQTINGGRWLYLGTFAMNKGTDNFVKLFASDPGYTTADGVLFERQQSTGISQTRPDARIITTPQPFKNGCTVSLSAGLLLHSVTVYALSGAVVESQTAIDSYQTTIGSTLMPGIYLVKVRTSAGEYHTKITKIR